MNWLWTWGGKFFGYLEGKDLWTYPGNHVGKLNGKEIFGTNGEYLGELMNGNRLITNQSKSIWRSFPFLPYARRVSYVKYVDYVGYVMYVGHNDFPVPEKFS